MSRQRHDVLPWAVVEEFETPAATVKYRSPDFIRAYDWMRAHYSMWAEYDKRVTITYKGSVAWLKKV